MCVCLCACACACVYVRACVRPTWCGELGGVSEAPVLLLIGVGQLLEAAIGYVRGRGRGLTGGRSDGGALPQGLHDALATGL